MAALPSDLLDSLARVYARAAVEEYLAGAKTLGAKDRGGKNENECQQVKRSRRRPSIRHVQHLR
jgi:hypothetical protein